MEIPFSNENPVLDFNFLCLNFPRDKSFSYIKPFLDLVYFPIGVMAFTLMVGLYPAIVAGKMKIANALRKSL